MVSEAGRAARIRSWQGGVVLAALIAHALSKGTALLPEMLWACHVASLVLAIGLLFDRPKLVAVGLLFHAGQGAPAYLLEVVSAGTTSPTSFLVHLTPIAMGGWSVARTGLARGILLPAWLLHPISMVVSYWLTDPALNVNLAHAPWPPVAALFPRLWMSWLWNLAASFSCLFVAERLLRAWDARRRARRAAREAAHARSELAMPGDSR